MTKPPGIRNVRNPIPQNTNAAGPANCTVDAFGLPELYYLGAALFRIALSAFLEAGMQEDHFSERTVVRLTRMLCADNAKRAYGLGDQM